MRSARPGPRPSRVARAALLGGLAATAVMAAPVTLKPVATIALGGHPLFMAEAGPRLYVIDLGEFVPENAPAVRVVDTAARSATASIPLEPGFPRGGAVTPDGKRLYVAVAKRAGTTKSVGPARVVVIDTATDTVRERISLDYTESSEPVRVAIAPDGKRAYVTNRGTGQIDVIDTATDKRAPPIQLGADTRPTGIAITPDGTRAYVADQNVAQLTVIDLGKGDVVNTVALSLQPGAVGTFVAMDPKGRRAYVAYTSDRRLAVVDVDPASARYNHEIGLVDTDAGEIASIALDRDAGVAAVTGERGLFVYGVAPGTPEFGRELGRDEQVDFPSAVRWSERSRTLFVTESALGKLRLFEPTR